MRCLFLGPNSEAFEAVAMIDFWSSGPVEMAAVRVSCPDGRTLTRGPLSVRSREPRYVLSEAFGRSDWVVRFPGEYEVAIVGTRSYGAARQVGLDVFIPCPTGEELVLSGALGGIAAMPTAGGYKVRGVLIGQDHDLDGWRIAVGESV